MISPCSRRTFLAGSAAFAASAGAANAADLTGLRLAGAVNDDVTPMLYAVASGEMRRVGLDLTVDRANSGSAVAAGVVGGAYQIGKSSVAGLITAHARGIPFVFVAPGGLYESTAPVVALLARSDSNIRTGADLNGKVCAVSAIGDLYTISLKAWVDQNGGKSSTLKFIEIPLSAVPAALEAGRIDAGSLEEPAASEALAGGKVRVIGRPYDAIASHFMYTGWFAMADFARKNRALLDRFRSGLREATLYTNTHKTETVELSAHFAQIDPAIVRRSVRVTAGTALDPKLIQPMIDCCAKYQTIPAPFDAREMIDPNAMPRSA